jgi:hypothetical protein
MGKPKAPAAPNPVATAGAQTSSNISTALAQQQLNSVDQIGPQGSVKYSNTGQTYSFTDPSTGQVYNLPKMQQTTTLSADGQKLYNTNAKTSQNLGDIALSSSARLGDILNKPFSLNNDAVEGRINELASKRLDPALARAREAEITRLSNQGIKEGTTAFDRALSRVGETENDARNQLLLTGRNQAVNEALLERSTPINEIIGLSSGTQVANPSYAPTGQTGLAGTDIAGINANAQAQAQQQYGQQMQQYNSTAGGLFGLGASALMAFSDKRLKENIEPTGERIAGVPVVEFDWKGSGAHDKGVLAQDVERKHPDLVDNSHPSGFKRVAYGKLMSLGASAQRKAA